MTILALLVGALKMRYTYRLKNMPSDFRSTHNSKVSILQLIGGILNCSYHAKANISLPILQVFTFGTMNNALHRSLQRTRFIFMQCLPVNEMLSKSVLCTAVEMNSGSTAVKVVTHISNTILQNKTQYHAISNEMRMYHNCYHFDII